MTYSVRVGDFTSMNDAWEEVLPLSSTNTIFVTPWWQRVWWRNFGEGFDLSILSVSNDDGVAGVAPLMINDGVVSFVGDKDLFDYLDFLVPKGKEEVFYNALWDHLKGLAWDTLELSSLPENSPTLKYLPPLVERSGFAVESAHEEMIPVAALPATWDEYLSGLNKKDRHELRRKLRRLESADSARQYVCDDVDVLPQCMEDFFRLLRASSDDKLTFLTAEREKFFIDVALELAPKSQFKLYFLEVGGIRVASCICFDYGGSYLLYNSGYDPDYAALSVGLLNKALCIKDAIEEGRDTFNFLKGSERYKYNLGAKNTAVHSLVVHR
jgi:hypothetical protein